MTTTISDIAADVRRLCLEHFPRSTDTEFRIYVDDSGDETEIPSDITRLAMIGAMVLATHTLRSAGGWMTTALRDGRTTSAFFFDRDHGGDELRSLHAAFLWAKEAP